MQQQKNIRHGHGIFDRHFKSMFQFTIDTIVCLNLESIKNKEELQKNKRKTCNENGEKTKEIKRIYITQEVT